MTHDELLQLVTLHLDQSGDPDRWSAHPGAVLYSGLASVRPGRFYMLGINPGGNGGSAIRDALYAEHGANHNTDQDWEEAPGARTRFQRRVGDLIDALGVAPGSLPSSNLAFARSSELDKLGNAGAWFQRCWPVHQALLRKIMPAWIMMLGFGKAYYFLSARGRTLEAERPILCSGVPIAWTRRLDLDLGERDRLGVNILAVAHPSDRGFAGAGLGTADRYPDVLREFIALNIRPDARAATS